MSIPCLWVVYVWRPPRRDADGDRARVPLSPVVSLAASPSAAPPSPAAAALGQRVGLQAALGQSHGGGPDARARVEPEKRHFFILLGFLWEVGNVLNGLLFSSKAKYTNSSLEPRQSAEVDNDASPPPLPSSIQNSQSVLINLISRKSRIENERTCKSAPDRCCGTAGASRGCASQGRAKEKKNICRFAFRV